MNNRRRAAFEKRLEAAEMNRERVHPDHFTNGDEQKLRHNKETTKSNKDVHCNGHHVLFKGSPAYPMTFTKGLPHNFHTGLAEDPDDVKALISAIQSGDPRDFRDTPLGHKDNDGRHKKYCTSPVWKSKKAQTNKVNVRAWESQGAGLVMELEGPDAQSVTMPPAPRLGSAELTAEMGEIYVQALLRDVPFNIFTKGLDGYNHKHFHAEDLHWKSASYIIDLLNKFEWFNGAEVGKLTEKEICRRRIKELSATNAFRGITFGDHIGPYLSQFLLAGTRGINGRDLYRSPSEGIISYGGQTIDQRVRKAQKVDYMTTWEEYFDVQNGADFRNFELYEKEKKTSFIHTPRDLSTYVHYDALYQAYLNAALIMLNIGVPFDPGIPFQRPDDQDHQQGFAHFGAPHVLSLVTEVAKTALKAVRYQKFNCHRRLRPEALAARLQKADVLGYHEFDHIKHDLKHILKEIDTKNGGNDNFLLPMAFCEGSPMHPSYGAGHATVAGACVTILKAFFDSNHELNIVPKSEIPKKFKSKDFHSSNFGYVSTDHGQKLKVVEILDKNHKLQKLTVAGELNKLASNISIGRNWAGVHYFSDYYESLLMGEKIAIRSLQEQKLTFGENFSMQVPLFDGRTIII